MKIVVCIRQGLDGEINPFDASAYEAALQISGAEITLLSMGPESAKDFLLRLTRLGAKKAILLSDRAFAGADTLATAYTLSLAIHKLKPDLVFCGRQTLVGDTAQTGPMLSVMCGYSLITNVMGIKHADGSKVTCVDRDECEKSADLPALITIERIHTLRLPRLGSKLGACEVRSAVQLGADPSRCGLNGSPTRVIESHKNVSGRRNCKFIGFDELSPVIAQALAQRGRPVKSAASSEPNFDELPSVIRQALAQRERPVKSVVSSGSNFDELPSVIRQALAQREQPVKSAFSSGPKLQSVFCVGEEPLDYVKSICNHVTMVKKTDEETISGLIKAQNPDAVIWASDPWSKQTSARVAARLNLGLCADCTSLETDGKTLYMIRPALAGSVIAKIKSLTRPAMATVRTTQTDTSDVIVAAGFGARNHLSIVESFAESLSADLAATRKMVDNDFLPYHLQVGLTGKTVSPLVYIAVGVSGAVHHIAGMQQSGTIIAVNPDRNAPIFDYADYGIVDSVENIPVN